MTHRGPVDQTPQEEGNHPGNMINVDAQQAPAVNALAKDLVVGTVLKHVEMHLGLGELRYGHETSGRVAA